MEKIRTEEELKEEMEAFAHRMVENYKWRKEDPNTRYLSREMIIADLEYILDNIVW